MPHEVVMAVANCIGFPLADNRPYLPGPGFHIIFYWCHRIQYQVLLGPLDYAFGHLVIHAEATVWEDPDLRRQRYLEQLSPTVSSPTASRASSDE